MADLLNIWGNGDLSSGDLRGQSQVLKRILAGEDSAKMYKKGKIRRERTQNVKYLSLDIYIKSNSFVEKQAKIFFLIF